MAETLSPSSRAATDSPLHAQSVLEVIAPLIVLAEANKSTREEITAAVGECVKIARRARQSDTFPLGSGPLGIGRPSRAASGKGRSRTGPFSRYLQ